MKKISEVEKNHSLRLYISMQVPVLKRGGYNASPFTTTLFPVDDNVSSMALILTTDREKVNNLERK